MNKKQRIILVVIIILSLGVSAYFLFLKVDLNGGESIFSEEKKNSLLSPILKEIESLAYTKQSLKEHVFEKNQMSPLIGSALLDIDNDGREEVFIGGGYDQNDTWYEYQGGKMVDITERVAWQKGSGEATYGTAVVDYDRDGDGDIFVARVDGVFFYENMEGRTFAQERRVETSIEEGSVPTGITLGDVNADGQTDMFISTYLRHDRIEGSTIFNKESHGTVSRLLIGRGNLSFEDITEKAGLLYRHNTFVGTLSDLDNDRDLDLVVAYDTGSVRVYANDGKANFSLVGGTPWENKYGYPMGIGIGDINDDQLPDLFFSNTGESLPKFVLRGDLRKDQKLFTGWMLYQNQGGMKFSEESSKLDLDSHEFAWGGVLVDINFDGREDLVVSENYIKIPQHRINPLSGRVFLQVEDGKFVSQTENLKVENPQFSLSSLIADWNDDGLRDILWVNIDGSSQFYLSDVSRVQKTASIVVPYESRFLGSAWKVVWGTGKTLHWRYDPTEGLGSTQSRVWSFLSDGVEPEVVRVVFPDGGEEDGRQWYRK